MNVTEFVTILYSIYTSTPSCLDCDHEKHGLCDHHDQFNSPNCYLKQSPKGDTLKEFSFPIFI